jgi:hypothetical protein
MYTWGQSYYVRVPQSEGGQVVFGDRGGVMMRLDAADQQMFPALEIQGVVGSTADEAGLSVSYYDLQTGKRAAQVKLAGHETLTNVVCDGNYLWLLADKTLYRWDVKESSLKDETVYTSQMYTEEVPDVKGLENCRSRADELENRYGFTLDLYRDAQKNGSQYGAQTEFQVDSINQTLDVVERCWPNCRRGSWKLPVMFGSAWCVV